MRLVYMDEAGISKQEPFVVVSGVIVDADKKLIALERDLDRLVVRFIPEEHRDGFVFHATELFNGGGKVFKRGDPSWPIEKRLEIADALCALAKKHKLPLAFGFVRRETFPLTAEASGMSPADLTVGAHAVAFMVCAMQVEIWMRQNTNGEVCMLVVENNESARRHITESQVTYQNPQALKKLYGGVIPEKDAKYFPFRRIKQRPLFEPKAPSSVLQLADFYAYTFKKILARDPRYGRFVKPIWDQMAIGSVDLPPPDKESSGEG